MSVEAGVLVGRRSRGEIERLVAEYGASGMGRAEFCRSQGLALSTLGRHLRKQRSKPSDVRSKGVERSKSEERSRLMAVEGIRQRNARGQLKICGGPSGGREFWKCLDG